MDAASGQTDLTEVPAFVNGDPSALFADLYVDLKRLAHARLRPWGDSSGLTTTAVVHESFLKLAERGTVLPRERPAFFAYVGKVMRTVVLDCVRERRAKKRGGDHIVVTLTTNVPGESLDDKRLLAIDDALHRLERMAPDLSRLVEMRYFAGLSIPEISAATGKAMRTLERDWRKARGLLRTLIG
jgi:RNA polymerase sigma factor (TIGR02999 family)